MKNPRHLQLEFKGEKSDARASGGQNPFYKKGSKQKKIFHWEGLDTLFFFVSLRVTSWLKTGGGFWESRVLEFSLENNYN